MLFLRQQALESSVKFDRLPRNVRKVALCLSLGAVRGREAFFIAPAFDTSFLNEVKPNAQCKDSF